MYSFLSPSPEFGSGTGIMPPLSFSSLTGELLPEAAAEEDGEGEE